MTRYGLRGLDALQWDHEVLWVLVHVEAVESLFFLLGLGNPAHMYRWFWRPLEQLGVPVEWWDPLTVVLAAAPLLPLLFAAAFYRPRR